jgi:LemA protein
VKKIPVLIVGIVLVVILGFGCVRSYNSLVGLDQGVRSQWGQVESAYQRRADLIPNLVATVKGAANFEKDTFTAVAEARSRVGQVSVQGMDKVLSDPEAFKRFQEAQQSLTGALQKLMAVSERYPDLKATAAFQGLQAQLEGTENRINVERMRFNEAAQAYNTKRQSFPTVLFASIAGFKERPYFSAQPGAETAPKVQF